MTEKGIKRIRLLYGILLSVALVTAAVCLMVACAGVYRTGAKPYFSREEVAAAFAPIAVPVYTALVLTVGGAFLHLFLPAEEGRLRAASRPAVVLARLHRRGTLAAEEAAVCKKEQSLRLAVRATGAVICTVCTAVFLVYALNQAAFTDDVTGSVLRAMRVLLPCLAGAFAYGVAAHFVMHASIKRETDAVLRGIARRAAEEKKAGEALSETKKAADCGTASAAKAKNTALVTEARLVLLTAGLFLLIYGFATGGIADVLTKAVNICTECIGLG